MDVVNILFIQIFTECWAKRSWPVRVVLIAVVFQVLRRLIARLRRKSVDGQVVLVTGGASGIGKQIALRFSALGAKVVLWDLNADGLEKTAHFITSKTSRQVYTNTVDITDRETVYEMAAQVKSRVGKVDILINNAGIVSGKSILDPNFNDRLAEKTMAVNTTAHIWTIRAFVGDMVTRNHGHVVTIASAAGLVGTCGLVDYCASKFGAVGLNEALRREFKSRRLTDCHTTVVCPFYINTGMFEGVRSPIIPILDESYVAQSVVNAIRENESFLGLPSIVHYGAPILNGLLPVPLLDLVFHLLGLSQTMNHFVGRKQE